MANINLRLPDELHQRLRGESAEARRSLNAHIIWLLDQPGAFNLTTKRHVPWPDYKDSLLKSIDARDKILDFIVRTYLTREQQDQVGTMWREEFPDPEGEPT